MLSAVDNFIVNLNSTTTITLSSNITINNLTFNVNSSNGSGLVIGKLDVLNRTLTTNGVVTFNPVRYQNSSNRDEVQIDAGSGAYIFNGSVTFHTTGNGDTFITADNIGQGSMTFNADMTMGAWAYTSPGIEPDFIYDASSSQSVVYSSNSYVVPASMIFGQVNSPVVSYSGLGSRGKFSVYDGQFLTNNSSIADINGFDCDAFFNASLTINNGSEFANWRK